MGGWRFLKADSTWMNQSSGLVIQKVCSFKLDVYSWWCMVSAANDAEPEATPDVEPEAARDPEAACSLVNMVFLKALGFTGLASMVM